MLIQVLSDLHLETFPAYEHYHHKLTDAPYLALLGDIGHVANNMLFELFRRLLDHYFVVFYLLGNHDSKDLTMEEAKVRVRNFEKSMARTSKERTIGKFVFLDQNRYDLDSRITVLGCTLFSRVTSEQKGEVGALMVDFKDTKGWTVDQHNAAHASDVEWLNSQVQSIRQKEPHRNIVIFTHHSPTIDARANDPRHKHSHVSSGFVTDLSDEPCWTCPNVRVWCYGHTHTNCDFSDETTGKKVFTNQRGYYKFSQPTFDEDVALILPEGETQKPTKNELNVSSVSEPKEQPTMSQSGDPGILQRLKKRLQRSLGGTRA